MDKNSVTRTFSIGAISGGTKAPDAFSTARRHSSAGMRALLWATSNAASYRCSLASDSQTSRENLYPNILTPDSIPQFTIPSLSVESGLRSLDRGKEKDDVEPDKDLGSSGSEQESSATLSSSASTLVLSDRRAGRSVSDPLTHRRSHLLKEKFYPSSYTEAHHCLDPASRAALSLPHLAKVTTPYGFITLSQSPQMASEEALLCQAGLRRLSKDEETTPCLSKSPETGAGDMKGKTSHLSDARERLSKDSSGSQTKGMLIKAEVKATSSKASPSSASTAPRHTEGKRKRRFYGVILKHFISRH